MNATVCLNMLNLDKEARLNICQ
ncbi:hypothetical protein CBM2588_A40048 [Cupriavidus taiwanensis]|nr:hypothetical protein CBM2588_A40048 [Cupriavidus taiwanensis]